MDTDASINMLLSLKTSEANINGLALPAGPPFPFLFVGLHKGLTEKNRKSGLAPTNKNGKKQSGNARLITRRICA